MAIVRAPLKTDASGKCTRWRVILYNPATHKQEWHTIRGTETAAKAFERDQETRLSLEQQLGPGTLPRPIDQHRHVTARDDPLGHASE